MAAHRGIGLGALLLFFILAVVFLHLVRGKLFEGYEPAVDMANSDLGNPNKVGPSGPDSTVRVVTDANIDPTLGYDSRKRDTSLPCNVDASGKVCPEGTFCDGPTRSCIHINAAVVKNEVVGYYS